MPKASVLAILKDRGISTARELLAISPATLTENSLRDALQTLVDEGTVLETSSYDSSLRREVPHYELAPSQIDGETGIISFNLALLSPDALGEILRSHVFGAGRGYRDMTVHGPYGEVPQDALEPNIVDELLGDPECRDEWMKVYAWQGGNLLIAHANDGDTSLLFQIALPSGTRTLINHDAKHDYGWTEVENGKD